MNRAPIVAAACSLEPTVPRVTTLPLPEERKQSVDDADTRRFMPKVSPRGGCCTHLSGRANRRIGVATERACVFLSEGEVGLIQRLVLKAWFVRAQAHQCRIPRDGGVRFRFSPPEERVSVSTAP